MNSRSRRDDEETGAQPAASGVVDMAAARQRRAAATRATIEHEIEAARESLDRGMASEAEGRLRQVVKAARYDEKLLADVRCALSAALEMRGNYREALEAVAMYETPAACAKLDAGTLSRLRAQLGLAYNYSGDHPKAVALLNATLREAAANNSDAELGAVYVALSRVYRSLNEYPIARDYAQKALEHSRRAGDWRGLAEVYFGTALADVYEGDYETALENFDQALKLVGDRPAPHLLSKIYANKAGACWFLRRPIEGIRYLEKAISYYESTEHKANAILGYNNLGINLMLVGDWARAEEALERARSLAAEVDENFARLPMVLDSIGQLRMLRGDLEGAQEILERAAQLAKENGNKWYEGQALRTLGQCHLTMGEVERALAEAEEALALAERIGDRQAICEAQLLLAEAHLHHGDLRDCAQKLQEVLDKTTDSTADLAIAAEAQRLLGALALAHGDATLAAHHFSRSVSMCETLGDRYRLARARFGLGQAYAVSQPERAAEYLTHAERAFRELGAPLDLERSEAALAALDETAQSERRAENSALTQLLTLRLAEAVASRELLLRELAAVIHQETNARRILVVEQDEELRAAVVVAHGCAGNESERIAEEICLAKDESEREKRAAARDGCVIPLRASNAQPAWLFISPRASANLPGGISLDPLLRVVELGMNVCALRARVSSSASAPEQSALAGASLMPGFIHSSPAMTRLVEEVHKIRSSDVTVLITGESGTGKELVARAIHALSSRRSKVFIPFNCTAVPKELSDAYLFGYRRGSFTGATSDSSGVIRTAEGGTLFLDEIGDLPLDVQPKLLRFLQEGEIQPLGEQRPAKVDVRVIAATNTDLEKMVTEGRFREDLYYRLNVIRLCVPPLRERRSEIPTIVNYYVNHYSAKFGRRDIQITPQAVDLLMVSDWPGNVRELCNELQRIIARAEDGTLITPDELSPELRRTSAPASPTAQVTHINAHADASSVEGLTLADALADLERRMIAEALRKHKGNISRAARELGLTRRGLYLKLERYELSASA